MEVCLKSWLDVDGGDNSGVVYMLTDVFMLSPIQWMRLEALIFFHCPSVCACGIPGWLAIDL